MWMNSWIGMFEKEGRAWLFVGLFMILDLILKGFALWRSARKGQKWWFIALLLVNSLGILPAVYLLTNKESRRNKKK